MKDKFIGLILLMLLIIPIAGGALSDNLVAYYDFEQAGGNLTDTATLINNGTNFGARNNATGIIDFGWDFNATEADNVTIPNDPSLVNETLTINVWFNASSLPGNANIIGKGNQDTADGSWQLTIQSDGDALCKVKSKGVNVNANAVGNVSTGNFTMMTCVFNSTTLTTSIYINGEFQTNTTSGQTTMAANTTGELIIGDAIGFAQPFNGTIDEIGIWTRELSASEITDLYNSGAALSPLGITTTLNSPLNDTSTSNNPLVFNITATPVGFGLTNATLFIYNSLGVVINETTNSLVSNQAVANTTTFSILNIVSGVYQWNVISCGDNLLGLTLCSFSSSNFTFTFGSSIINESFTTPIFDTNQDTFQINISTDSSITLINATLNYNSVGFTTTITNTSVDNFTITRTMDIPIVSAPRDITFNWTFGFNDSSTSTTISQIQFVNESIFDQVGTNNVQLPFINFTFKNETASQEDVNATITGMTVSYYLGTGAINKSFTYSNTTESHSYLFGFNGEAETVNADMVFAYNNIQSSQRTFDSGGATALTNATTEQVLFLLPNTQSSLRTIQVLNVAQQPIAGALLTFTRAGFPGSIIIITTGSDGTATVALDSAAVYTLVVSAAGFQSQTFTQQFSTDKTITLGTLIIIRDDFTRGISITLNPGDVVLGNGTTQEFNLTLTSSFWTVTNFGYILKDAFNGSTLATQSLANNGGFLSTTLALGENTTIVMDYFWTINGTTGALVTSNSSFTWIVSDLSGNEFSILNFFTDLKRFAGQGIFGLDDFGLWLIGFLAIFIFTGVLSFKFGLTNPVTVMGAAFAFILFLDYGAEILPNTGPLPHPATIISAMVFLIFIFRRNL